MSSGKFPLWSSAANKIYTEECPANRYQPIPKNSSEIFQCEYEKSVCDEEGEVKCDDGSTTTDRQCRCDYKQGWIANIYAFINTKNKTCYFPRQVHRGCKKIPCSNDQDELDPGRIYSSVKWTWQCTLSIQPSWEFHKQKNKK